MSVFDDALIEAQRIVRTTIRGIPNVGNFVELLQRLQEAEVAADAVRQRLFILELSGAVSQQDRKDYDALRFNLYTAQNGLYKILQREVPTVILRQIPAPIPMPDIPRMGARLGAAPAAAPVVAAATVANPWFWAAVILATVVLASVLVAIVMSSVSAAANVLVVWQQSQQYNDMLQHRHEVYNDCISAGGTAADCAATAQGVVPTPQDALPRLNEPLTMGKVLMFAAVVCGGGALGYYGFKLWRRG